MSMTDGTDVAEPGTEVVPADVDSGALVPGDAEHPVAAEGHAHPGPRQYVLIALVLVILTAFEVAASYTFAGRRLGPRLAPTGTPVVTRFQLATFSAGMLALWIASDWPVHDLGEGYLFSVHMVQHTVYTVIAAPLLLMGTPTWLARWLLSPRWLLHAVRSLTRMIPATIVFNVVVIVTHLPVVVDASLRHAPIHFGVHTLLLVSSLLVWMLLLSPLPEVPRLQPLVRMVYLFLQSVVPTVPASFLTFGDHPLYRFYETVPRLWGVSALDDMNM